MTTRPGEMPNMDAIVRLIIRFFRVCNHYHFHLSGSPVHGVLWLQTVFGQLATTLSHALTPLTTLPRFDLSWEVHETHILTRCRLLGCATAGSLEGLDGRFLGPAKNR